MRILLAFLITSVFLFLSVIFAFPDSVSAEGLVPSCPMGDESCDELYAPDNYGTCELVVLGNNILRFVIGLISLIATIVLVYAGYLLVISRGNVTTMTRAKEMFSNVLVGVVIMLSAFLVVNTVMAILVGSDSPIMQWNNIECSYANKAGTPSRELPELTLAENGIYMQSDWVVVGGGTGRYSYGISSGSSGGKGGGSCSVITDPNNACHPSNLGCFGNTAAASRVCNLESSGGQVKAVSGTDRCKTGHSFSGGLFQINVLANYDMIPGCNSSFFVKNGGGAQGNCLRRVTNSNGVQYCAVRDCAITNTKLYNHCMTQIMSVDTNLQIACALYKRGGWKPWITSATACKVI